MENQIHLLIYFTLFFIDNAPPLQQGACLFCSSNQIKSTLNPKKTSIQNHSPILLKKMNKLIQCWRLPENFERCDGGGGGDDDDGGGGGGCGGGSLFKKNKQQKKKENEKSALHFLIPASTHFFSTAILAAAVGARIIR